MLATAQRSLYSSTTRMIAKWTASSAASAAADRIASRFSAFPEVEAVVLAGSRQSQFADDHSDVDLYVYASDIVPTSLRAEISRGARRSEIGNSFWEPGDEWIDDETGIDVDVMFRTTRWIEDQLDRVLQRHEASVGYSTCFWYNVRNSRALFDRAGWFKALQERAGQPFPEQLKRAIIAKNHPILRDTMSSYLHQIELALARHDPDQRESPHGGYVGELLRHCFRGERPAPSGRKAPAAIRANFVCEVANGNGGASWSPSVGTAGGRVPGLANTMLDGLDELLRGTGFV